MNDHFQQDDDFWNQIYSYLYQENLLQDELLILDQDASLEQKSTNPSTINEHKTSLPSSSTTTPLPPPPPPPPPLPGAGTSINDHGDKTNVSTKDKKIMKKENERQRRQHMSTLHSSLRSLLPVEYIKGKRSISDHMNEAVNYIKQLKANIKELSVKREKLKNKMEVRSSGVEITSNSDNNNLAVSPWLGTGVEIVMSRGPVDQESGFLLSRVLHALLEEGFEVVSFVSTRKDERLYDTIQCQASNLARIDATVLQQKLNDVLAATRYIYN